MFEQYDSGITTIDKAREELARLQDSKMSSRMLLAARCWEYHSESRNKNGNKPFTFQNYLMHIRNIEIMEHVKYDLIKYDDVGNKECVIDSLLFDKGWDK